MAIGPTYSSPKYCQAETDRIGQRPYGADAGLTREQILELFAELALVRSKLAQAEERAASYQGQLEAAGLLRR